MISNAKIDKLGEKLKSEKQLTEGELAELLNWRNSFSPMLNYYHQRLKNKIDKNSVVAIAKRIKRIESIRVKLRRFKTMRLSTLQDIAGLRVILQDKAKLDTAFMKIRNAESVNKLKRLDDYHYRPKEDGYRGIHLVFQSVSNSKMVEIQLRTELEHIWATAVEVYGILQKESFKTGEGTEDWKEFFKILSSYLALEEESCPLKEHEKFSRKQIISKLQKLIRNLKVIERLNAATNSIEIVINKRGKGRFGKYAILELDYIQNTTTINIYPKKELSEAIEEYTKKELSVTKGSGKNIVFVNLDSIDNVQKSYPNYFLDTKRLLKILSQVMLSGES